MKPGECAALFMPPLDVGLTPRLHVVAGRWIEERLEDGWRVTPAGASESGFDFHDEGGAFAGTVRFSGYEPSVFSSESFDTLEAEARTKGKMDVPGGNTSSPTFLPGSKVGVYGITLYPKHGCTEKHFFLAVHAMLATGNVLVTTWGFLPKRNDEGDIERTATNKMTRVSGIGALKRAGYSVENGGHPFRQMTWRSRAHLQLLRERLRAGAAPPSA